MGCGNTKQRQPHRAPVATATVPPTQQQQVCASPPQFEQNEPELQQYQQNYNNNNNNSGTNNNELPAAYLPAANNATTTTVTTTNTTQEPLPSAPCDDLEIPQHETENTNNLYTEQKPPNVELSEVQITRIETPPQQAPKPVINTNPPVTKTTTMYVQEAKPNMSGVNANVSYNNGKAADKERANTVIDENGQEVRLPKGNWFKAEGTEYYYSAIENLYFHPPSKQFYDPTNEMWYDPSTREWYRDDATEDGSIVLRAQHEGYTHEKRD